MLQAPNIIICHPESSYVQNILEKTAFVSAGNLKMNCIIKPAKISSCSPDQYRLFYSIKRLTNIIKSSWTRKIGWQNILVFLLKNIFCLKCFSVRTNCRSQHSWVFFIQAILKVFLEVLVNLLCWNFSLDIYKIWRAAQDQTACLCHPFDFFDNFLCCFHLFNSNICEFNTCSGIFWALSNI